MAMWVTDSTAQEWTRFRGPNGTGITESTDFPAQWDEASYLWKIELPGTGHSSPVVWNDRLFLLSANPEDATRYVLCYDVADGNQIWQRDYASGVHAIHTRSSFASCTPAVDQDHVYVGWSTRESTTLLALDHDGKEVWKLDLGPWVGLHGFGASPIVHDDMVILHNSQQADQLEPDQVPGQSFMLALDRRDGSLRWQTPRVSRHVCYSVPFIYEPEGGSS